MAKQTKEVKKFEFSKVGSILDNIAKNIPIQIEKEIKEKTFISTGVYLLDAALSARLLGGGFATNRITCYAGESGAGKSFLCYSCVKQAQKVGYYKVEDINITLSQLIEELKEQKMAGFELPKLMIVLDSLGQMASNKEKSDLLKGDIKADFTKAKALGSMFRSINTDLGFLDIPMLVANHTYLDINSMFPAEKLKGGNGLLYSASVIGFMSKSKLKTGEEDDMDLGSSGISVLFKTAKNRLARPKKIRFDISFAHGMNPYTGLDAFCRPEFFEQIGIAKGKMEVDKKTGEMTFTPGGIRWYVRHLGKSVTTKQLFTQEIFTQDVLNSMAPIVNDYFRFKSLDEIEEVESEFNKIIGEDDDDEGDGYVDSDAADLFE